MGIRCSKPLGQEGFSSEQQEDNGSAPFEANEATAEAPQTPKRKNGGALLTAQKSIFRISRRSMDSPARASNYNFVRDAVERNFEEASTARQEASSYPLGVVGLRNLGNTCFMNSSLQCMSATIPLTDYFLGYSYRSEINKKNPLGTGGNLVVAYAELMKCMWLSQNTAIKPTQFKSQLEKFAPQFVGYHQHDAQEFLAFLLDGVHEDLNRIKKKPYIEDPDLDGTNDEQDAIEAWKNYLRRDKSLIVDIFQGQLRTRLQCLKCGHKNIRFEPFMYLSLPISDSSRSIDDCLKLYLQEEKLTRDNQWYCSKCKTHRDATKKTDLWILPPILIVHLKRFKFNEYGHMGSKNNVALDYSIHGWDLSRFVKSRAGSEQPLYDLYAVSNHVGGLGSGHYTAYAQNRFDDKWYELNDANCRRISERVLRNHSSSAYLLFYNRCDDITINGTNGGSGSSVGSTKKRAPLIRRQSVSRPDLWPHTQVENNDFRKFVRHSVRQLPPAPNVLEDDDSEKVRDDFQQVEITGIGRQQVSF